MLFLERKEVSFHPVWLAIPSVTKHTVNRRKSAPTQSEYHLSQAFLNLLRKAAGNFGTTPLRLTDYNVLP